MTGTGTDVGFRRARSEQQRAARREAILATARTMLAESRVADLSLNELGRRVGLAKSNVLRYFESREAVLLELLVREEDDWLHALEATDPAAPSLVPEGGDARIEAFADAVARTTAERPLLCELWANSAGVLEHNVSTGLAVRYKRSTLAQVERLGQLIDRRIGGLDATSLLGAAAAIHLLLGGLWAATRPSASMSAAYEAHPELAVLRLGFASPARELVATLLLGLRTRALRLQ